jgi:hypothetical protein
MRLSPEEVQEFRFTVVKGARPGSQISFDGGGTRTLRIGRAVDNEVVIADPTVSRVHAKVEIRHEGWFLIDAGSAAGIEKMGFRVGQQPEPLESGDEFKLGDTILKFEVVAKKGAIKRAEAAAKLEAQAKVPPKPPLLTRLGLGSPRTQMIALVALVLLAALALWPTTPELPPQAGDHPVVMDYEAIVGFFPGGDQSHLDKVVVELPNDAEGVGFYFEIMNPSGADVRAGSRAVGRIEPEPGWRGFETIVIPRAVAKGKPRVDIDNPEYELSQGQMDPSAVKNWGVRRMWVARIPNAATSNDQVAEELRALHELNIRIRDNVGSRWAILSGLRRSLIGLMKLSGQPTQLIPIPAPDKVAAADIGAAMEAARIQVANEQFAPALSRLVPVISQLEGEINREYRKQMNIYELAKKRNDTEATVTALATLARLLPETTDPRNLVIRTEVQALQGLGAKIYKDYYDRLGSGASL